MTTQYLLRRAAASACTLSPPRLHGVASAARQLMLPGRTAAFQGRAARPRALQGAPSRALRPSRTTLQDVRGQYSPPPPPPPPRLLLLRGVRVVLWGTLVLIVAPGVVAYFTMREPVVFTGRDRAMLLSPEQEAELGRKMLAAIPLDKALPPDDPRVIAVSAIARRLAAAAATVPAVQPGVTAPGATAAAATHTRAHSAAPVDTTAWRVFVIDEPVRNAFAAPGGIVVVYRGMLEFIDGLARRGEVRHREGAVAAVLAHEIGHVLARHSAEKLSSMPLSFALRILLAPVFWVAIPLGIEWPYSRALEGEADLLGLEILRRACYAMDAAPEFYRASHSTPAWAQWVSTHPSDATRAATAAREAARLASLPLAPGQCPRGAQRKPFPRIEAMLTCGSGGGGAETERDVRALHRHRGPVTGGPPERAHRWWPGSGSGGPGSTVSI